MVGCSALNCHNTHLTKKLYRFPRDPNRCKIWAGNTRRGGDWKVTQCSRLCEDHFEKSQFEKLIPYKLIRGAIPTIFKVPNPPKRLESSRRLLVRHPVQNTKGSTEATVGPCSGDKQPSPNLATAANNTSDTISDGPRDSDDVRGTEATYEREEIEKLTLELKITKEKLKKATLEVYRLRKKQTQFNKRIYELELKLNPDEIEKPQYQRIRNYSRETLNKAVQICWTAESIAEAINGAR